MNKNILVCLLIILHLKQLLPNVKLVHVRDSELKMDAGVTAHDVIFFFLPIEKVFQLLSCNFYCCGIYLHCLYGEIHPYRPFRPMRGLHPLSITVITLCTYKSIGIYIYMDFNEMAGIFSCWYLNCSQRMAMLFLPLWKIPQPAIS